MSANVRNRIAIVLPYFGKLPKYFSLFLMSVEANPAFTLLLVTDCDLSGFKVPQNARIMGASFEAMRDRVHRLVPQARISAPYKLCDYRPLYGLLFADELRGYDFWGYCDADMLWGDLSKYVTDSLLDSHDKLFTHGHFTLYRNCPATNRLPLEHADAPCGLAMAMKTDLPCYFDEVGMAAIARRVGMRIYDNPDFADISPAKYRLSLAPICKQENKAGQRFYWSRGRVVRRSARDAEDEFMYIHLQKRQMKVSVDPAVDGEWEIRPNELCVPDAPVRHGIQELVAAMRQEAGFQLSRIKRLSPERVRLSFQIKRLRAEL